MAYEWNAATTPFDGGEIQGVAWSSSLTLFVAVGKNFGSTRTIMTSPDGVTWTERPNSFDGGFLYDVCWSGTKFVAVGFNSAITKSVMTSPDGITWTVQTCGLDTGAATGVDWSPSLSLFVVVGNSGPGSTTFTSPDGVTWTSRTTSMQRGYRVYWSSDLTLWIAGGANAARTAHIFTSPDGTTWTTRTTPLYTGGPTTAGTNAARTVWYPDLSLLVTGSNLATKTLISSPDGITWTAHTPFTGSGAQANGQTVGPDGLVVAGYQSGFQIAEASTDLDVWTQTSTDVGLGYAVIYVASLDTFVLGGSGGIALGTADVPPPPILASTVSPLWRFLVTELDGTAITLLDHLATERTVTPKLNEPLEVTFTVPSDSVEVNRRHGDNFPQVAEGVRQLYCFRREGTPGALEVDPLYVIRGSTLILQTTDAAHSDDARTRVTAWDPLQYMFYRPVAEIVGEGGETEILPRTGKVYNGGTYDDLILEIIDNAATLDTGTAVQKADMFVDYGQTGFWTGTFETCATVENWRIEPGQNVATAIQDICAAGFCDVWFEPIYDPVNRPGYLCQLSIFAQSQDEIGVSTGGMGDYVYTAQFAWDFPGNTLVGADNQYDGTQRANLIQMWKGQGGAPVALVEDSPSHVKYGAYWAQQFFPAQTIQDLPVVAIAAEQLALRKVGKETLTVNPAPERAPRPFQDYGLGDRVPVYISDNLRQPLPPYWPSGDGDPTLVWQRVYGIPINIDDNGTETVSELLVGPVGAPPGVPLTPGMFRIAGARGGSVPGVGLTIAVRTARARNRAGGAGAS